MKKFILAALSTLVFAACTSGGAEPSSSTAPPTHASSASGAPSSAASTQAHGGHEGHHAGSLPADIRTKKSPRYAVGSKVTISTDHMPGMKGARGTVAGAFETTTYAVDYTPTTGGPVVKDHKWVVHEEIRGAGDEPFEVGEDVVLEAAHMDGMEGARGTISRVTTQTVYTVTYTPTDGSPMVEDHMWVTEDELTTA